jgi:hypothetical protein
MKAFERQCRESGGRGRIEGRRGRIGDARGCEQRKNQQW